MVPNSRTSYNTELSRQPAKYQIAHVEEQKYQPLTSFQSMALAHKDEKEKQKAGYNNHK